MIVALKNILNDLQLKMLSSNIRKVTALKRERGDYPSGGGPYGYNRGKENSQQLIIDLNVAPIVREIFDMKLDGLSLKEIAAVLNERGILTPNAYWKSIGRIKSDKVGAPDSKWHHASIRCILQNPYYTGNCMNGRYKHGKMHERIRLTDPKYAERKLTNLKTQKMALYESYCDNEITKEVYLSKKADMDIQIQEMNKLVENRGTSDVKPAEHSSCLRISALIH